MADASPHCPRKPTADIVFAHRGHIPPFSFLQLPLYTKLPVLFYTFPFRFRLSPSTLGLCVSNLFGLTAGHFDFPDSCEIGRSALQALTETLAYTSETREMWFVRASSRSGSPIPCASTVHVQQSSPYTTIPNGCALSI